MSGHADVQKQLMGPLIKDTPLAAAFRNAIPIFEQFGMEMDGVDLSNWPAETAFAYSSMNVL